MKVFANREIRILFRTVLAVWAVALALTQGVAWHTTHAFSFGSLFVFLLLGGCLWGILFCYFQRQSALLEQAVQKTKAVWMATRMHGWTATGRENFTVCFTPLMHWRQF